MSGPEPGGSPTPEAPPPSAWTAPPPGPQKAAGPAPGITYADLGVRIGAYIIDVIVMGVVYGVIATVILAVLGGLGGLAGVVLGFIFVAIFGAAFSAIYFIYGWTALRASPGQKVLNLETVNAADGKTLTQPQAIKRWLVLFGPFVLLTALQLVVRGVLGSLFGLVSLGYLIYLLYTTNQDAKRQGFHDLQAATVVVKRSA
jgi:uncharacterized RDD family membrane protein YckC